MPTPITLYNRNIS
ncbi:hypothetical protein VCCP104417_0999, partial [Vibrio cholerae CP1044(17)]